MGEEVEKAEKDLKAKFYSELEKVIKTHGIKFLGEECKAKQKTIPRELSTEQNVNYCEIDMPIEERKSQGIPDDYLSGGPEVRASGIALREDFMVRKFLEARGSMDPSVIICGSEHVDSIAQKLRDRSEEVTTRELTNEPWFDPPWAKMSRGEL